MVGQVWVPVLALSSPALILDMSFPETFPISENENTTYHTGGGKIQGKMPEIVPGIQWVLIKCWCPPPANVPVPGDNRERPQGTNTLHAAFSLSKPQTHSPGNSHQAAPSPRGPPHLPQHQPPTPEKGHQPNAGSSQGPHHDRYIRSFGFYL